MIDLINFIYGAIILGICSIPLSIVLSRHLHYQSIKEYGLELDSNRKDALSQGSKEE